MPDSHLHKVDVERVARGASLVFVATFAGLGLNYLYGVMLARHLGPQLFGFYSVALGIFNVISMISILSMDSTTMRFLPKMLTEGRKPEALALIKLVVVLCLSTGTFFALLLFLSSDYLAVTHYHNAEIKPLLYAFALAIPAFTLTSLFISLLQSFHDVRTRMAIKYISEPIVKFLVTLLFFALGWQLGAAMTGIVFAMWMSALLGTLALRKHLKKMAGVEKLPIGGQFKPVVIFSLTLAIGTIFNLTAIRADVLLIGGMISTEQAGIYAAAFQTASILGLILSSVEQIIAPMLSEVVSGSSPKAKQIYALSLRWPMLLGMPLFTIFVVMAPELLGIFGPAFRQAVPCLIILLLGQMVVLTTGSSNYFLLVSGHAKTVMMNELIGATLLLTLNFLLIPRYGIVGAAMAVGGNLAFINILRVVQVYHYSGLHPYEKTLWKPALVGIAVFAVVYALRNVLGAGHVLWLVPFTVVLYVALIALMGIDPSDKKAAMGIVNRIFPALKGKVV